MKARAQWQNPRDITKRIVVQAELVLATPTHMGCGDTGSLLDMPLLRDPYSGNALLTGSTLAGALRAYLVRCNQGEAAERLFGRVEDKTGYESPLIVDDAVGLKPSLEIRDGVAIDPATRTASDKKKYDFELMQAGMKFYPYLELLVPQKDGAQLVDALADALHGLENGEIGLGKRTRRGFGECKVAKWKIWRFGWNAKGVPAWLNFNYEKPPAPTQTGTDIRALLSSGPAKKPAAEQRCILEATFKLVSSMLIRSKPAQFNSGTVPDIVHLHNGSKEPIVSGTSLAGVLRGRSLRILRSLHKKDAASLVGRLFGDSPAALPGQEAPRANASRVRVKEILIKNHPLEMVHTRVSIDRFTGGALESHLFSEQPVFGKSDTELTIRVEIDRAQKYEVGLLLLLLKDLWLGDLRLGGESSVGRGRLSGKKATLTHQGQAWTFEAAKDGLNLIKGKVEDLAVFMEALTKLPSEG